MTNPRILLEDFPHIFERLYRASGVRAVGSGLGLAIVRSIAQAHGGQVSVESEPGVGSLLAIELAGGVLNLEHLEPQKTSNFGFQFLKVMLLKTSDFVAKATLVNRSKLKN